MIIDYLKLAYFARMYPVMDIAHLRVLLTVFYGQFGGEKPAFLTMFATNLCMQKRCNIRAFSQ
jgi:hypothetical protein